MLKETIKAWKDAYRDYKFDTFHTIGIKRDQKAINRARKRAILKNKQDGRTYYILRDNNGIPGEYNSTEVKWLKRNGILNKNLSFLDLLEHSLAIVTSNKSLMRQYSAIQAAKEKETEIRK